MKDVKIIMLIVSDFKSVERMLTMKNYTTVKGIFMFDQRFYVKNHDLIDTYFANTDFSSDHSYGIKSLINNQDGTFSFNALGHKSFRNVLPWLLSPFNDDNEESNKMFSDLLISLNHDKQKIDFICTDYNPKIDQEFNVYTSIVPDLKSEPADEHWFNLADYKAENAEMKEKVVTD